MAYKPHILDSSDGGTGISNSSTITLGGAISTANSLTTSGNFALTLTQTGATNVTLPTSGTLATTSQLITTPVSIANGGTNAASFTQSNGIVTYNGTSLVNYAGPQISSSGVATNTAQPAFLAYLGTTDTNATGDGTVFTVGSGNALTEVYDQGSNFVTTGTFTAPVTGKYLFTFMLTVSGGVVINGGSMKIITSNREYRNIVSNSPGSTTGAQGVITVLADMDTSDTATFTINTSDTGGKIDDISGGASPHLTFMSGYLVC